MRLKDEGSFAINTPKILEKIFCKSNENFMKNFKKIEKNSN